MFKLIVKDLAISRKSWMILLYWLFFVSHENMMAWSVAYLSGSFLIIPLIFSIRYKTETLYFSLPIKRSSIVYSKYLGALLSFIVAAVAGFLAALVKAHLVSEAVYTFSLHDVLAAFFPYVLLFSVLLPLYFRDGLEFGKRPGSMVGFSVLMMTITAIVTMYAYPILGNVYDIKYSYAFLGIGVLILAATSLKYSLRIYSQREY